MSSNDELSSDTSSSCGVESLHAVTKVVEGGDLTEEDEDDEDGIRFVTLESRFESKETVLNW